MLRWRHEQGFSLLICFKTASDQLGHLVSVHQLLSFFKHPIERVEQLALGCVVTHFEDVPDIRMGWGSQLHILPAHLEFVHRFFQPGRVKVQINFVQGFGPSERQFQVVPGIEIGGSASGISGRNVQ